MKKFAVPILVIIAVLGTGYYFVAREEKQAEPLPEKNEQPEERTIFEANLPAISSGSENNFFVTKELINNNLRIQTIREERREDISAEEFKKILTSASENEAPYTKMGEYMVIRTAIPGEDPEIGIIHSPLDPQDFTSSSGYVLDESLVSSQKNVCISTSSAYNNWACFIYDPRSNDLLKSYAQNFAD